MDKYRSFNKNSATFLAELKAFIAQVNKYLSGQGKDAKYHPSNTRGQSKSKSLTIEDDCWKLTCHQHREDAPFTADVVIYYKGQKVWAMKRISELLIEAEPYKAELQRIFYEVAERFDHERPWCGPRKYHDQETGLRYTARYRGGDERFEITEYVSDPQDRPLWHATCYGGLVI